MPGASPWSIPANATSSINADRHPTCVIHWFRRDLRLADNNALRAALDSEARVLAVFLIDERILLQPTIDPAHLRFLRTALGDLDRALQARGSRLLVVRSDDVPRELNRLAEETGSWSVYFNRDYTPYARARDTRTTRGLQMTGVLTQVFDDQLLVEPYLTMDEEGDLPPDFDSFRRRWLDVLDLPPDPPEVPAGEYLPATEIRSSSARWDGPWAGEAATDSDLPGATPAAARGELRRLVGTDLSDPRRFASRLDLALKFGTISVREVARAVLRKAAAQPAARAGAEALIETLARREYAIHRRFATPGDRNRLP